MVTVNWEKLWSWFQTCTILMDFPLQEHESVSGEFQHWCHSMIFFLCVLEEGRGWGGWGSALQNRPAVPQSWEFPHFLNQIFPGIMGQVLLSLTKSAAMPRESCWALGWCSCRQGGFSWQINHFWQSSPWFCTGRADIQVRKAQEERWIEKR